MMVRMKSKIIMLLTFFSVIVASDVYEDFNSDVHAGYCYLMQRESMEGFSGISGGIGINFNVLDMPFRSKIDLSILNTFDNNSNAFNAYNTSNTMSKSKLSALRVSAFCSVGIIGNNIRSKIINLGFNIGIGGLIQCDYIENSESAHAKYVADSRKTTGPFLMRFLRQTYASVGLSIVLDFITNNKINLHLDIFIGRGVYGFSKAQLKEQGIVESGIDNKFTLNINLPFSVRISEELFMGVEFDTTLNNNKEYIDNRAKVSTSLSGKFSRDSGVSLSNTIIDNVVFLIRIFISGEML